MEKHLINVKQPSGAHYPIYGNTLCKFFYGDDIGCQIIQSGSQMLHKVFGLCVRQGLQAQMIIK